MARMWGLRGSYVFEQGFQTVRRLPVTRFWVLEPRRLAACCYGGPKSFWQQVDFRDPRITKKLPWSGRRRPGLSGWHTTQRAPLESIHCNEKLRQCHGQKSAPAGV